MTRPAETIAVALPRAVLVLLGVAAATITISGLRASAGLLGPIFLAMVLTVAAHPLRGWLHKKNVPGWAITPIMIVTVYSVLISFAVVLFVATARFAALVPTYADDASATVDDATTWLSGLGIQGEQITTVAQSFDLGKLGDVATAVLGGALGLLSNLFFVVTLLFFLAIDSNWFPSRLSETSQERAPLVSALASFASSTRRYLLVSTAFGLIVAFLDTGVLWLMGIPAPLVWGMLAFITNYIPNIGFMVGLVPVAALALLEGGPGLMLGVIAVYSVINVVVQTIIQPKVVGDVVGLSPSLTFVSLVFWAWVLGAIGALLAIPMSLLAKALLVDVDPDAHWLTPLIGGKNVAPTSTPPPD